MAKFNKTHNSNSFLSLFKKWDTKSGGERGALGRRDMMSDGSMGRNREGVSPSN